jgi:hypothetical protein
VYGRYRKPVASLAVLASMLSKRFDALDPGTLARLATADAERLSTWALNFVDARTLDEVFRD